MAHLSRSEFDTSASASTALAQLKTRSAQLELDMVTLQDRLSADRQRMSFLLNAESARQDYYRICSWKKGELRHIIIDAEAKIVSDSEKASESTETTTPVQFDEVDETYSHNIQDTLEGREYFRTLRGHQKIPHGLPRAERQWLQEQNEVEARQLRQAIVDNFKQVDAVERQTEIKHLCQRVATQEKQLGDQNLQKDDLHRQIAVLETKLVELQRREHEEAQVQQEARRKEEHDRKRLAWLDRFAPLPRAGTVTGDAKGTNNGATAVPEAEGSEASTGYQSGDDAMSVWSN